MTRVVFGCVVAIGAVACVDPEPGCTDRGGVACLARGVANPETALCVSDTCYHSPRCEGGEVVCDPGFVPMCILGLPDGAVPMCD